MLKSKSDKIFDFVIITILLLLCIVFVYPMYFTLIASVSEPMAVVTGMVTFKPEGFDLSSYIRVFENSDIWIGYRNTIAYTVLGTILSIALTIPAAYALSKKKLFLRGTISTYFLITMFFSGGLLPTYLVVRDLNLLNKPYTMIILGGLSVYNIVVARTYFSTSISDSLYEAAEIDGCSQFGQFFKIAIPLAKPIIAVIALYYAVGRWNEYFSAMIYLNSKDYYPLQLVLRNILLESQARLASMDKELLTDEEIAFIMKQFYQSEAMKYSVIFIASLPMLILYPFIQKHFVKGVMVGSVKG